MSVLRGITRALVAVAALTLVAGVFAQAAPVSASPPISTRNYPTVVGVNGSSMSIVDMNINLQDKLQVVAQAMPAVMTSEAAPTGTTPILVTQYRLSRNGRDYVQVSGRYCKLTANKSGADVFVPDGAPVDAGVSC